ncbi:TonB C-terminal domain-containing protein [Thermomonas sp.]
MKETRADTRTALLQATGLHVLLFALMFAGLHWNRSHIVEPARGEPIEADLIDPSALSASMQRALRRDPKALPEPMPVPIPEPTSEPTPEPPPPEPVPEPLPVPLPVPVVKALPPPPVRPPDKVDQEKVRRDVQAPDPARVKLEQDAKRRQQQADLDAERERQLAAIRKQREQATREVSMAEQRARQLADARPRNAAAAAAQTDASAAASPPPGNRGQDPNLGKQYAAALQEAIVRQWTRPESIEVGQRCRISIRQIPGGEVVSVEIAPSCPYDMLGRRSVEAAILKASPLPYTGFEAVFNRNLELNFIAEDR